MKRAAPPDSSRRKSLNTDLGVVLIGRAVAFPLNLALIGLMARNLPADQFGQLGVFMAVFQIVAGVIDFGSTQAIIRFAARAESTGNFAQVDAIFKFALVFKLGVSIFVVLIGSLLGFLLAKFIYNDPSLTVPLQVAFFSAAALNMRSFFESAFRALTKFARVAALWVGSALAQVTATTVLLSAGSLDLGRALAIYAATPLAVSLLAATQIKWKGILTSSWPPREIRKSMIQLSSWITITHIAESLAIRLDVLMLAFYIDSEQVGRYFAAYTLIQVFFIIASVFGTVLSPHIARLSTSNSVSPGELTTVLITTMAWITAVAGAAAFAVASEGLELVYGSTYRNEADLLRVLIPAGVFGLWTAGTGPMLINHSSARWFGILGGLNLALNVTLNLLLIPAYGAMGAAVASSVSYAGLFAVAWYVVGRATGANSLRFISLGILLPIAPLVALGILLGLVQFGSPSVSLAVKLSLFAVIGLIWLKYRGYEFAKRISS